MTLLAVVTVCAKRIVGHERCSLSLWSSYSSLSSLSSSAAIMDYANSERPVELWILSFCDTRERTLIFLHIGKPTVLRALHPCNGWSEFRFACVVFPELQEHQLIFLQQGLTRCNDSEPKGSSDPRLLHMMMDGLLLEELVRLVREEREELIQFQLVQYQDLRRKLCLGAKQRREGRRSKNEGHITKSGKRKWDCGQGPFERLYWQQTLSR